MKKTTPWIVACIVAVVACICALIIGSRTQARDAGEKSADHTAGRELSNGKADHLDSHKKTEMSAQEQLAQRVDSAIAKMSDEEKVAQLFFVTPEKFTQFSGTVTEVGQTTREAFKQMPVGGIIYNTANLNSPQQVKELLTSMQKLSNDQIGVPIFLGLDEEGGTVARISGRPAFGIDAYPDMEQIGKTADPQQAKNVGTEMGEYLSDLGFNIDFAPVADVLSNSNNDFMRRRIFSSDPQTVSAMTAAFMEGLQESPVVATYKHFPGHGSTQADSHTGAAVSSITRDQLESVDLVPYKNAIERGLQVIMVGHMAFPSIAGESVPATLSSWVGTDVARKELGFEGILITDAMSMGAVSNNYSSGEAAVTAIQAGVDMILDPADLPSAYTAVLDAVHSGTISHERLDDSVRRILTVKFQVSGT